MQWSHFRSLWTWNAWASPLSTMLIHYYSLWLLLWWEIYNHSYIKCSNIYETQDPIEIIFFLVRMTTTLMRNIQPFLNPTFPHIQNRRPYRGHILFGLKVVFKCIPPLHLHLPLQQFAWLRSSRLLQIEKPPQNNQIYACLECLETHKTRVSPKKNIET